MVHDAISDEAAADLRASGPDFHPILAGREVHSAGTKSLLREARQGVSGYKEKLDPDTFLALLDWAHAAVHNGDLDSRDNIGLRAHENVQTATL